MFPDRFTSGVTVASPSVEAVSRRDILKMGVVAGGRLTLGFALPGLFESAAAGESGSFAPDAFIRIDRDNSVTLTMPYVEMGQGTYTSVPMLIAEELEIPLNQVRLE